MGAPKIALVEVFRSLQGEGYNTGRDAIFVRLAGCNLSCVFGEGAVCDTPYQTPTLGKVTVDELFEDILPDYILQEELDHWNESEDFVGGGVLRPLRPILENQPMFVLTGGEPTLSPAFDEIVRRANTAGFYTAVETNGTRWRETLYRLDWVSVSPKNKVPQGSTFLGHNPHPGDPTLSPLIFSFMARTLHSSGEYRYVIGPEGMTPPVSPAFRHYLSPAILSDGTGLEWQKGFPGFLPGALEKCREIIRQDPRWRLSTQDHKYWKVR